ncbi:retrovirus-related pol polyprotein from transposon TNT 1-94 [Tanacetum coccineum]
MIKMARKKEEEANKALIESWENTQAMMEANRLLAERLQTREQEELTDQEKASLFMELWIGGKLETSYEEVEGVCGSSAAKGVLGVQVAYKEVMEVLLRLLPEAGLCFCSFVRWPYLVYNIHLTFARSRLLWENLDSVTIKPNDNATAPSEPLKLIGCSIVSIRIDHSREFDNEVQFGEFCNANGIIHNFLAPRTPQSNGVVERKNRTLQEMSRTMLNEQSLPQKFWCNAVDTSTYILNRILIKAILGKTPYELLRGRKPTLDYFKVFRSKCFNLNTKDYLTKFDPKSYEGVFLGYSQNSKAHIILNKHTRKVEESLNVTFDETPPPSKTSPLGDDDLDEEEAIKVTEKKNLKNDIVGETLEIDEIVNIKESRNHPLENVIGNLNQRTLRSQAQNQSNFFRFISTMEPKNVNEALGDESWIVAMQEELN